jgi:hypothetical protein
MLIRSQGAQVAVNIAVFCGFFLIVFVMGFFLWQTLFASKDRHAPHAQASYSDQGADKDALGASAPPAHTNPAEEAIAEYTRWLAFFTAALVLATMALFISGERNVDVARRSADAAKEAANAARDSVKLAESTAERQLRAYIFPSEQKTIDVVLSKRPSSEILIKNSGLTPATNVTAWAGITVANFPLKKELSRATPDFMKTASRRVVGPGGSFKIHAVWDEALTTQHMQMLANGTAAVFIWGEITYVDVFGHTRKTGINSYYGGDTGLREDGFTTTATDGNEAD